MSVVKIQGNASGTGIFTVAAPNSNTDRTLTLPDQTGTVLTNAGPFTANASASNGAVTIDALNNVGIGTSTPQNDSGYGGLTVNGANGSVITLRGNNTNAGRIYTTAPDNLNIDSNGSASGTILFRTGTGSTERARIDSSGNLLVGTTNNTTTDRLAAISDTGTRDTALIQNSNSSTFAANVLTLGAIRTTTNSTFNFLTCVTQNVAFRLHIRDSGNVVNQNNSYGAISDAKLKENVMDATPKLEKLTQVRVVNYNLKGETQKQIGVIAQELEQVFPGMVEETPDRDAEGNDLGTTTKNVKYSVFVPMLIKAVQEQQALIESLTARIAALEAK